MVHKVVLGQVFLSALLFPAVSIIPPLSCTELHLNTAANRTNRQSPRTFSKSDVVSEIGGQWTEKYFDCFYDLVS